MLFDPLHLSLPLRMNRAVCCGLLGLALSVMSAESVSFAEAPTTTPPVSTQVFTHSQYSPGHLAVSQHRFGDWVITIVPGERVRSGTASLPAQVSPVSFAGVATVVPADDLELTPELIIPARGDGAAIADPALVTLLSGTEADMPDADTPTEPDTLPVIIPDAPTTDQTESPAITATTDTPESESATEPTAQLVPATETAALPENTVSVTCAAPHYASMQSLSAAQSDPLALAEMYRQTYDAIGFNRVEYEANPSYRHELAVELMFGQFRPSPVIHNQVTVSPTFGSPSSGFGAGWPHVPYSPYRHYLRDRSGWTVRPYHFSGSPLGGHGSIWGPGW